MGARKRVRRFLRWWSKDGTHPQEYIAWSGSQVLAVKDLEQLIADSRELRQVLSDFRELEVENEKLNERITQLEHEAAPELPELDEDQVADLMAGDIARIRQLEHEVRTLRETIAQWNGAEERWTAKREAYEAEIQKLRADSDKLTEAWLAVPVMDRNTGGLAASIHAMAELRQGDIATIRSLEAELRSIEALIPGGYTGTTSQKVRNWTQELLDEMSQTWKEIPLAYHPGSGELHIAVRVALYDLNAKLNRNRAARWDLSLKLRDKVAPEVNGKGPDGASRVQRWVETYRSHNNIGPGAIHSTVIKEEARTITLYVNDIEATLRQLNEARSKADKHKRAADKLQQFIDVPEHFAASITKALSQLLTDPDE